MKTATSDAAPKIPVIKRPDPVELVRKLLRDEELVRPVKLPLQVSAPPKRMVRKARDRKPTLPTRVILPPKPMVEVIDRPMLLIKPRVLPPPPGPKRKPRVYLEPVYPTTTPKQHRLPQQPSKYIMQSTVYHTLSEPMVRERTPPPRIKPLPPRSFPIWTDLYRKQAIRQAEEVVIVPELKSVPVRPIKIRPPEPVTLPPPATVPTEWIDETEFEMPIRGARRRHLVLPAHDTFEKQMRDLTLEMNQRRAVREESQARRNAQILEEEERQKRELSAEIPRRKKFRRPMSMPPMPVYRVRSKSLTPDVPKVPRLPPSKMDEWNASFKRKAARALVEPFTPPSSYPTTPHRRRVAAPSRIWMPSTEYHSATYHDYSGVPAESSRPTPDIDDHRLRMLKEDIEVNKKRRAQRKERHMDEVAQSFTMAEPDLSAMTDRQMELENRRQMRMRSMPPARTIPKHHGTFPRYSPMRGASPGLRPMKGIGYQRRTQARGMSLPPQRDMHQRQAAHLPIQPSKYWLPSGEYHHRTGDEELKRLSVEREYRLQDRYEESSALKRLNEEFERDRKRREDRRLRHEKELATAREEDEDLYKKMFVERERRSLRQASMPPLPAREIIKAENIPKTDVKYVAPPPVYKPARSTAREQEIEIETITKRINENIEEYEDSLRRRQHYTIPVRKVIATPSYTTPKSKRKWSRLYTTVSQKVEEETESSEEEEWVTIRKRRNKRHLVIPSSEMSRKLTEESIAIPRVLVSHRSIGARPSHHGEYNVVEIHEKDVDHTRQPLPKPHFTEDADFDSDWHAMTPRVHSTKGRVKVVKTARRAAEKLAPSYDKRTPAADSWLSIRSKSSIASSESSSMSGGEAFYPNTKIKRHLVTPPFAPKRASTRDIEPISVRMLKTKSRRTKHALDEEEYVPEAMARRSIKTSRHNLVMPGWNPDATTSERPTRRDTPPRSKFATSSPVDTHRGRSFTPLDDSAFTSPSPIRPGSLGRRAASVSHIPRATPGRDLMTSSYEDSRRSSEFELSSVSEVGSRGTQRTAEHHVHPLRDTFKGAVELVRENLPWRQIYNESIERVHARPLACKWSALLILSLALHY